MEIRESCSYGEAKQCQDKGQGQSLGGLQLWSRILYRARDGWKGLQCGGPSSICLGYWA